MTGILSTLADALLEAIATIPKLWKYLILTRYRPRNLFTTHELQEIQEAIDAYTIPSPTGWAHALGIGCLENSKKRYAPDRIHTGCELFNLGGLLYEAGIDNPQIYEKITRAVRRSEWLGVWDA